VAVAASYDDQDRLDEAGSVRYAYSAAGELTRETDSESGDVTRYRYDAPGALLGVELPGGRRIDYVIDGAGERVGKKVDGTLTQGFLYDGDSSPVAELDADGSVRSRFVYAGGHAPAYMVRGGRSIAS
jgi:YD repeat-containing protein